MPTTEALQLSARPEPGLAEALAAYAEGRRSELRDMLAAPGAGGVALARRHTELADELLCQLYAEVRRGAREPALLMGAVGGYGRCLLGLGSDLDVCFVTTAQLESVAPVVEALLYPLWDAGIDVGHQVVRVNEAVTDARSDLLMATELLDFRPLAGSVALMRSVQKRLSRELFSEPNMGAFLAQLEVYAGQRHDKFGDSVYLLEPDVKNGTGGLRDLDFALWAARARFGTSDLDRLSGLGVFSQRRLEDTERAVNFLWTVRNHLHNDAGRKQDRLTFAAQEAVARALGYDRDSDPQAPELERTGEMVERFMSDYYRHARVVAQTRDRILGYAKRSASGPSAEPQPLQDGLVECGGRIGLDDPDRIQREPLWALRVYERALALDAALLSRTRDAVVVATADAGFCERLREEPRAARLFVDLLCSCRPVAFPAGSTVGELHDVGLLLAMIPEFAPVVGRVHHDLYHVYTVDVHSVAAVARLGALVRGDLARTHPLACRLAAEISRPAVLFLATLLHDIGKVIGGRDHAGRGALMARDILLRLGLSDEDADEACELILHHLTMYMVAARRDLGDPATIREFVRDVRGREGLRHLYLLTVADLSTTSAVSMTPWKASMLAGLFRASDAHLSGPGGTAHSRILRVRDEVFALWADSPGREQLEQFLASMPERYFLSNAPEEVVAHARLAIAPEGARVALSLVPSVHEGVMGLCVVTRGRSGAGLCVVAGDRPGLLASIAAAIHGSRLSIQSAQINSRNTSTGERQAVDLFWVQGEPNDARLQEKLAKLEHDLTEVVEGHVAPASFVEAAVVPGWRVKPFPKVATDVVFDHHGSEDHTIIEVLTEDRPALLFTLAAALHQLGVSISVAKISTEGRRAIDVFYACEMSDGSKIEPGERSAQIRAGVVTALTSG